MTAHPSRADHLARLDARVHRCPYDGTWLLGAMPCGTCARVAEVAA